MQRGTLKGAQHGSQLCKCHQQTIKVRGRNGVKQTTRKGNKPEGEARKKKQTVAQNIARSAVHLLLQLKTAREALARKEEYGRQPPTHKFSHQGEKDTPKGYILQYQTDVRERYTHTPLRCITLALFPLAAPSALCVYQ